MKQLLAALLVLVADAALAATTAFFNVNVVPMTDDAVIAAQTVIVEDGIITVVGDVDAVPVPEGAIVVDGTDRYLMPGLAEMHAHVPDIGADSLAFLQETGEPVVSLRKMVTSKGGTTEAALNVLERRRVREHLIEAVRAAAKRSKQLSTPH